MFHLLVQKIQLESILKKHMRVNHMKKKKNVPRNKKPDTEVKKKEVKGSPQENSI